MRRFAIISLSLLLSTGASLSQETATASVGEPPAPCGPVSLDRCVLDQPKLALAQLEAAAQNGSASAYEYKLLGDLYAGEGELNAPSKAAQFYERGFKGGDLWAGMALAKLHATSPDSGVRDRAIEILETIAEQGGDAGPYALYEAAELRVRRNAPGDAERAQQHYAAALKTGNVWATLPLVRNVANGKPIPVEQAALVAAIRQGVGTDAVFFPEGIRSLDVLAGHNGLGKDRPDVEAILRELANQNEAIGHLAKVELGKRLAVSKDAAERKEALQMLEQLAREGAKPAQFALGELYARSAQDSRSRRRASALLQSGADGEPALQAQAHFLIAEMFSTGSKASDKRKALLHYEHAAAAGNSWASYKLALAYIDGSAGTTSPRLARIYGEKTYESGNVPAGIGALFSLHGTPYDLPARKLKSYVANGLKTTPVDEVVEAMTWVPLASQVRFAQKVLKDRGEYRGRVHGELTRGTVRSIQSFCKKQSIKDCEADRVPKPVLASLVSSLQ